ncbi:MAG: DUF11 domain-containing protein [Victivallales bacterium]|nr:DUF11 domain-containing protein [Victivallales bacterium]MCF7888782.1 DUF11 domain-containing protein [Victivallales bacterium]
MKSYKQKLLNAFLILIGSMTVLNAANAYETVSSYEVFPETSSSLKAAKLTVDRKIPKNITPGKKYKYNLKVTNQSLYNIDHVIIEETIPENFTFIGAVPRPTTVRRNSIVWKVGMMAPRQKEIFSIEGKAVRAGKIKHEGKAIVAYDLGSMNTVMDVVSARLNLTVENPRTAIVTEIVPAKLTVSNIGTSEVVAAEIKHKFSKGLTTPDGSTTYSKYLGDIKPSDTLTVNIPIKAKARGEYKEKMVVNSKEGVKANAILKLTVGEPKLVVEADAPGRRFVGNNIMLSLKLRNAGDGEAKNTKVVMDIPSNVKFLSANEGGTLKQYNKLVWDIGTMQPDSEKKVTAILVGKRISTLSTKAVTTAKAVNPTTSQFKTNIEGIPALLVSLGDINDPVPVGGTETYVVQVDNQGSLAAKDIVIKCELNNSMKLVGIQGPTKKATLKNNILTLKPLGRLKPKDSAVWKITVKALKAGDIRFKVFTESRMLKRPVFEDESTHFYVD